MPGKVHVDEGASVPAGVYKMKFVSFVNRNEQDEPVAKSTDQGLKLFFNYEVIEGEAQGEVVPASTDMEAGIVALCNLLTGKPPVSQKLAEIEKQLQGGKIVEMAVNDSGWARGPMVPKAAYLVKFAGFSSRDKEGRPVHVEAEYKQKPYRKVFWNFRIVAGDLIGVLVPASCSYPVKVKGDDLELKSKSNLYAWAIACGLDWSNLPAWKDKENILPELEQVMLQADRIVSVQVGDNGWIESSQGAVGPAPQGLSIAGEKKPEPKKPEALFDLYQLMRKIAEKRKTPSPFDKDGNLNDAGKAMATEMIAPICVEHGIPRGFGKMNEEQIKTVIAELKKKEFPEQPKSGEDVF